MSYIVGVSSGAFGVTSAEERPQLAGLFRKAQSSITKGVTFVQLDLESVSEFVEPDLKKKIEEDIRKKLGIEFGIHSETKAFGVEAAELDSAIKMEYDRAHKRIVEILKNSKAIGSKYVLIHSSESEPFPLLERVFQSCDLVDVDGGKLSDFLLRNENGWLTEWVFGGNDKDIVACAYDAWLSRGKDTIESNQLENLIEDEFKKKNIEPRDFIFTEVWGGSSLSVSLRRRVEDVLENIEINYGKKFDDLSPEEKNRANERIKMSLETMLRDYRSHLVQFVQSRTLHYGPERLAYYLMAKWMERTRDPLWEKIVNASIKFFAEKDGKTIGEWMKEKELNPGKLSIDDKKFRLMYEIWVPAVSARYIYGHLFPKEHEDPKKHLDGMIFVLESPMGGRGIEEWLRLGNPYLFYFLIEEANQKAGKEIFALALDFEHMLSLRFDPELVIKLLPENGGKYVRVIHAGWPSTLAPSHLPIEIGSDQQRYLYERYYELKQKGMGKENDVFIVFERGGPETFQQSMIALKLIAEFLKNDINPKDLIKHPEFFGIKIGDMASEQRQLTAIREHAYDPLKGLLMVPEEEHGMLGRAAVDRGKTEEWRKERYR
jgi:hypothetical protein